MSNALAVEALLQLVRVTEAAERAHQEAREAESVAAGARDREHSGAAVAGTHEQVMPWQDETGRSQADVPWRLGRARRTGRGTTVESGVDVLRRLPAMAAIV